MGLSKILFFCIIPIILIIYHQISKKMSSSLEKEIFDRAYGCLLGQAIGDALGTRYEFKSAKITQSLIVKDRQPNSFLPILGGGPFDMELGQVTDDTEMAMALARSLQREKKFDIKDVARSYAVWYFSNPPDIGITTRQAFATLPKSSDQRNRLSNDEIYRSILESSKKSNSASLSNGCLMRISPLAIAGSRWPLDTLRRASILDCQLTHSNPIAHDAVAAYVTAIWYLINTGDRKKAYEETISRVETSQIRQLLEINDDLRVPIINGEKIQLIDGDTQHQGYLGIALKWAFFHLRTKGENFEQALIDVIGLGGDTDTNGCIAGALLGSYAGVDQIPIDWISAVLKAKPRRLNEYDWVDMSDAENLCKDLLSIPTPQHID